MYAIATELHFRVGHYLRFAGGQQEEPHQHNWRVRVIVEAEQLDGQNMVLDFIELSNLTQKAVKPLTQAEVLNELPDFAGENPSTERLARYIYDKLAQLLHHSVKLSKVKVWETPTRWASYRGDN